VGAWHRTVTRDTVVAAHGGTARALVAYLKIAPPQAATHFAIDQGVVYVFAAGGMARYG
jgi:broad specificity phosphatase PhoE